MADGEFEGVTILQVGDAFVGVVVFLAAGVGARHEGLVALDIDARLEHKPLVLLIVMPFECLAFVHKEHGHGACAGRDAAQVFAFADDADGGDDVQAVAARHRLRRHGASVRERDDDRLLPLGPLPFAGGEVVFEHGRVVAPLDADAKFCGAGRHQHTQAHGRREVAASCGARFRRRLIVIARPPGLAVFEFALGVVLVALLARRGVPWGKEPGQIPAGWGEGEDLFSLRVLGLGAHKVEAESTGETLSDRHRASEYFGTPPAGPCRTPQITLR